MPTARRRSSPIIVQEKIEILTPNVGSYLSKPMIDNEKIYSSYDVHLMLNARAGVEISEYEMQTLLTCWRLHRRVFGDVEQTGYTKEEVDDFLNYAY